MSNNRVRVLSNLDRVLGNVTSLNLSFNEVQSLDGLDKLYSLQKLNLSSNRIDDFAEVSILAKLPCLESLQLDNNPIGISTRYRINVFHQFVSDNNFLSSNREFPVLDGVPIDTKEQYNLRGKNKEKKKKKQQLTRIKNTHI